MPPAPKHFPDEDFVANKAAKFVPAMEALVGASPDRFRFRFGSRIARCLDPSFARLK
jgi:hypothetical protein